MPTPAAHDVVVPAQLVAPHTTSCPPADPPNAHHANVPNASQPIPILNAPHDAHAVADPRHMSPSTSPSPCPGQHDSPSPINLAFLDQANKTLAPHPPSPAADQAFVCSPSRGASPINDWSTTTRALPSHTSSYLHGGSVFEGTQQSDRQVYNVKVEVKHVDMAESFICGYLTIQGLTQDHPTLTTYFEGEIIGTKYSFQTRRPEWGSSDKVDMQHWNRFGAWKPLAKAARSPEFSYKNFAEREDIFMRWKEYFLVPDHRVRTISGASFEGFYYICFNQKRGTVSGIYFHSKSEKFQQLELHHVEDHGCAAGVEFR